LDDIPRSEIDNWLRLANNSQAFAERLEHFSINGMFSIALDYLDGLIDHIPAHDRLGVIAGLYVFSDLPGDRNKNASNSIAQVLRDVLQLYTTKTSRIDAFKQSIKLAPRCIYAPIVVAYHTDAFGGKENAEIKQLCLDYLKTEAKESTFIKRPQLYELLRMWETWEPETAQRCAAELITKIPGLLALLESSINIWSTTSLNTERKIDAPFISFDGLSKLVPIETLSKYVEEIPQEQKLTDRQKIALTRFAMVDNRRKQGLPIDDNAIFNWYFHSELDFINEKGISNFEQLPD
jgi:hypothetical protein